MSAHVPAPRVQQENTGLALKARGQRAEGASRAGARSALRGQLRLKKKGKRSKKKKKKGKKKKKQEVRSNKKKKQQQH